jgi:pectate lyase
VSLPDFTYITSEFSAERPALDSNPLGYTNARSANTSELARFANALRLSPEDMAKQMQMDSDVKMSTGAEGMTFTNTTEVGNRFVRFFYHPTGVGLIDFSALNNYTGKVGMTLRADVDLSADRGGFFARMNNAGLQSYVEATPGIPSHVRDYLLSLTDAGAYSRLSAGVVDEDVLLEMYANEWTDPVYIELTLPPLASVTVKELFLHMETEIRGFADIENLITGGAGASAENTHTVNNVEEMFAALSAVRGLGEPSIIYIDGTLTVEEWDELGGDGDRQFAISDDISNLSIIGLGSNALLDGVGFKIHGTNIIAENLTIRYVWMRNAFEINNARYVKVTRCTMHGDTDSSTRFDEMMSVKNHARYIVISWNHFHTDSAGRSILMGSNDGPESLPDRKTIIHHNWFQNVGSRHPLVRGGYTHMYNNYLSLNTGLRRGANVRTRARVLFENNYFHGVDRAIFPGEEPEVIAGAWDVKGNIFDGGNSNYHYTESTIQLNFESAYTYSLDPAADVPDIVMAGAGAEQPSED